MVAADRERPGIRHRWAYHLESDCIAKVAVGHGRAGPSPVGGSRRGRRRWREAVTDIRTGPRRGSVKQILYRIRQQQSRPARNRSWVSLGLGTGCRAAGRCAERTRDPAPTEPKRLRRTNPPTSGSNRAALCGWPGQTRRAPGGLAGADAPGADRLRPGHPRAPHAGRTRAPCAERTQASAPNEPETRRRTNPRTCRMNPERPRSRANPGASAFGPPRCDSVR